MMSVEIDKDEMQAKERMQIRLSKMNVQRLSDMASRYGMTPNSLVSFIVGQWLDNNYELKDKVQERVLSTLDKQAESVDLEQLFQNPVFVGFMSNLAEKMVELDRLKEFE